MAIDLKKQAEDYTVELMESMSNNHTYKDVHEDIKKRAVHCMNMQERVVELLNSKEENMEELQEIAQDVSAEMHKVQKECLNNIYKEIAILVSTSESALSCSNVGEFCTNSIRMLAISMALQGMVSGHKEIVEENIRQVSQHIKDGEE